MEEEKQLGHEHGAGRLSGAKVGALGPALSP